MDYQEKRVEELEDLVQKCQINNDGLKLVTAELESEIKYLRQELEVFSQKEKVEKPKKKQRKQEASIESEKKKLSQFIQQVSCNFFVFVICFSLASALCNAGVYTPTVSNIWKLPLITS